MSIAPVYNEILILQRLQAGEEGAFKEIYERYAPSLSSFAAARLPSLDEAHDIIHDLFVHLWEDRSNINIQVSLRAFLYAAIRYRIIDHIRRNSTRRKYAALVAKMSVHAQEEAESRIYEKELKERLDSAISQLTPRIREVFRLSRFEHLTVAQIADRLNISEQTVKNQLTTALSHLRAHLGKLAFLLWWL
jgi:RNA polymerase sigma-70 factor (ECF subfamily)